MICLNTKQKQRGRWSLIGGTSLLFLLVTVGLGGCAKLPMENEAPSAPVIISDGIAGPFGVEFTVLVNDPDGDMVALQILATPAGGSTQVFSWTSFFDSGKEEVFLLNLSSLGLWRVTATARDELAEESVASTIELTVGTARSQLDE